MLAFTIRKFVNGGGVIPNLDEDKFKIKEVVEETQWGGTRRSFRFYHWVEEEEDYVFMISYNEHGWVQDYNMDEIKEAGVCYHTIEIGTAFLDSIYYMHNPIEFAYKNGKLRKGFASNLRKRLAGKSRASQHTKNMLGFYIDRRRQETGLNNRELYTLLRSEIGHDINLCPLSNVIFPYYDSKAIRLNNEIIRVWSKCEPREFGLTKVDSGQYVSDDYVFYRGIAYRRDELNLVRCPVCNDEVPDSSIDQTDNCCERCVENKYKIHNYSTRVPELLTFKAKGVKPGVDPLYMGIEIEYETTDKMKAQMAVGRKLFGHAIMKSDGSIRNGFEIVTCPATLDIHMDVFSQFFADKPQELKAAENVGMHVHVSRKPLNQFTIGKLTAFLNNTDNKDFIKFIAGRIDNSYARIDPARTITFPITRGKGDRYNALNLNPQDTIEFRIFSTPTNFNEFASRLQFVHALTEYCKPAQLSCNLKELVNHNTFIKWLAVNHKDYPDLFELIKGAN